MIYDYTRRKLLKTETPEMWFNSLSFISFDTAMSYLDKELFKVPGPTNYFNKGHPLTTFTFENADLNPSVMQGKKGPSYS